MKNILLVFISSIISTYIATILYAILIEQKYIFTYELFSHMTALVLMGHLVSLPGFIIYIIYSFSLIKNKKSIFWYIGSGFILSALNFIGWLMVLYINTEQLPRNYQDTFVNIAAIGGLFILSGALTGFFHRLFIKRKLTA